MGTAEERERGKTSLESHSSKKDIALICIVIDEQHQNWIIEQRLVVNRQTSTHTHTYTQAHDTLSSSCSGKVEVIQKAKVK